jgi:hypothetical protein
MNERMILEQAARHRREFLRWIVLLTANIARPAPVTLRMLLGVVQGEYSDATSMEVRRELDYLDSRALLKVNTDPLGQVSVTLTRAGVDIAEYTVSVEPGIARPVKV